MRNKNLADYIPEYPRGCSIELLALKAGYAREPYTDKEMESALEALETDLAWLTLTDPTLVERELPMQASTIKALKELGAPVPSSKSSIYLSRDKRSRGG